MSAQYPVSYDSISGLVYAQGNAFLPAVSAVTSTAIFIGTGSPTTVFKPLADAVNAINFTKANGTTSLLSFDTSSGHIGINTTTPNQPLVVNGNARIDGQLAMGPANPSAACLIDMVNPFVGLGVPAMTSAQKTAISPNRAGNVVFDTDLGKLCVNTGAAWQTVTSA